MKAIKKKPRKQLEKFSTLFMQLALVLTLFTVYLFLEFQSEKKSIAIKENTDYNTVETYILDDPLPFIKEKIEVPQKSFKKEKIILDKIDLKNDQDKLIESITKEDLPEPTDNFLNTIVEIEEPSGEEIEELIPFIHIEFAPIYKGCEGMSKEESKKCFTTSIKKFVVRKFNSELANDLGLKSGKHKILTQFIINKEGKVVDIKIRAPHPRLKKETLEILQKLPDFIPGKQRNKPVKVKYTLPISFQVH